MSTITKDLGVVTAYGYYKAGGGTMTEAEFTQFMVDFGTASKTAVDAAEAALESERAAKESEETATIKASEAGESATTASTKAGEAAQSASDATTAKNDAVAAKTAAETAQGKAETAQGAAERVAESIPSDYSQLSEDVTELKSGFNELPKIATPEDATEADLYICDSFGNVIAEFKNGHIVTKNFDSADYANVLANVGSLLTDVSALKTETSGIMYRTKGQTDGVYAACRYRQPNLSAKQFCLLIAGDIHADGARMRSMIEYLNAVDAFDAGIMLGDISGNKYTDTIAFYLDAIKSVQKPFLTVLGNHDVAGATSDADLYTKFGDCFQYAQLASGEVVSGKCYYFKDFASQRIRVIVLMQYDLAGRASDTGDLCFGQDQIDWLISVLNSTPSDYGVIIAEHTNPSRYMTYNMDTSFTSDTWRRSNYAPTFMDGDPVPDIVNAWINGITLSKTYSYTFSSPPTPLSVNADFTNRGTGEFITYLGGHWHMDVLGTPTGYDDQPDYHIPAAGLSAATQGDIPRKAGALSEDSLSVIAVDRDKKTVKVFHVGAHFTKDALDRQYFKYAYGT